jgi:hypothetical protein
LFFGPSNIGYRITDIRYRLQRYKNFANYANFVVKKLETFGLLEQNANFSECVFLFCGHLCFGFWRFVSLTG